MESIGKSMIELMGVFSKSYLPSFFVIMYCVHIRGCNGLLVDLLPSGGVGCCHIIKR